MGTRNPTYVANHLWDIFDRVHGDECRLFNLTLNLRAGTITWEEFDRTAERYHRETFPREYILDGLEEWMVAPYKGEIEGSEFDGDAGGVLKEALLQD